MTVELHNHHFRGRKAMCRRYDKKRRAIVTIDPTSVADDQDVVDRRAGLPVAWFPQGHVVDIKTAKTPSVQAMMVEYDRNHPTSGDWYAEDCHFFDMCFATRPPGARGYFGEAFSISKPLGKIFFAPAGHPYHGEGGIGRQKSLGLFICSDQLAMDRSEFGDRLVPVLHNCLRLESDVIRDLLFRIGREVSQPGFASALLLEGLSLTLLVETARLLDTLRMDRTHKGGLAPWRLKAIESRVRDDAMIPTLVELAELCQLSRRQLIRAYRTATGQTIGAFIHSVTMDRAKALLAATDTPVGEVAAALGFASLAGFSTAFRRSSGQSPSFFRAAGHRVSTTDIGRTAPDPDRMADL